VLAWTNTVLYNGQNWYAINVPTDGIPAGSIAIFSLNSRRMTSAPLFTGTNTRLDLATRYKLESLK